MPSYLTERARLFAALLVLCVCGGLSVWLYAAGSAHGDTEEAAARALDEVRKTGPAPWAPPETVANNMGARLAAAGEYGKAIAHFEEAVAANDAHLPAHKNLLAGLVETQQWRDARRIAERVEELHPLSRELDSDGPPEDEEKLEALRQELSLLANLGRTYLETGATGKAERRFGLLVALDPMDLRGHKGRAEVARRQHNWEKALRLYSMSLKLYGKQPQVASRLEEIREAAPELSAKVTWVLQNYAHTGARPPQALSGQPPGLDLTQPQPVPSASPRAPEPVVPGAAEPGRRLP